MNLIVKKLIKYALSIDERIDKLIQYCYENNKHISWSVEADVMVPVDKTKTDVNNIISTTLKSMIVNACDAYNKGCNARLAFPQNVKEVQTNLAYKPYDKSKTNFKVAHLYAKFRIPLEFNNFKYTPVLNNIVKNTTSLKEAYQSLCNSHLGTANVRFSEKMTEVPNRDELRQEHIQFIIINSHNCFD